MEHSKKPRLLLISYDYFPIRGGISTCAKKVANSLYDSSNYNLKLMTMKRDITRVESQPEVFPIIRVGGTEHTSLAVVFLTLRIVREVIFWKPNHIVCLLWYPEGLASFLAKRFLFWKRVDYFLFAHGVEVLETKATFKKNIRGFFSFIKKAVFRNSVQIFSVSNYTKKLVEKECGITPSKIKIVNNGVCSEEFYPLGQSPNLVEKYNIKDSFVLFTVCRLHDYKGVDQALIAIEKLVKKGMKIRYFIAGIGPDLERLQKLVANLELHHVVLFLGNLNSTEILQFYNLADCFILLTREDLVAPNVEGFGIVFLEAAACAKVVVAGNSGGIPDAVEDGVSGWIVDPLNPDQVAEKLEWIFLNQDAAKRMGAQAMQRARKDFSWLSATRKITSSLESNVRH